MAYLTFENTSGMVGDMFVENDLSNYNYIELAEVRGWLLAQFDVHVELITLYIFEYLYMLSWVHINV